MLDTTPKINLWIAPGACSLAPHIMLLDVGLPYTLTTIQVADKGYPEEHTRINPKRRVPILQLDDDTIITEGPAILTAISQLAPDKHVLGKTNLEVVRSYEWLNWLSGTLHTQGYGGLYRPARFSKDKEHFEAITEKGRETIAECYRAIDRKLRGRKFAVGDGFTAVDAFLLIFYRWGNRMNFGMQEAYPEYVRVMGEVVERESVRKVLDEEGIDAHGWD
ncbi:putative glutathione S-transferase [Lophiotrema nucula]|uniref:Putative glutathione S-transferase n=1 Tax=Lophiotrema nucula TaxID=690887 RepID=A0A6A5YJ80_9PLEO|nr:putative glutathione S-transferase [Lophiotrema nucula]